MVNKSSMISKALVPMLLKKIKRNVELLTNIGLSGQSEIMTDISSLSEKEIIEVVDEY